MSYRLKSSHSYVSQLSLSLVHYKPQTSRLSENYTNPTQALISIPLFLQLWHSSLLDLSPAPAAFSVVSWWCVSFKGSLGQPWTSTSCFPELSVVEPTASFSCLICSKIGYPMKLQLRFKQIYHYTHDNNSFVSASSIRKTPVFYTQVFLSHTGCLMISQINGLYVL